MVDFNPLQPRHTCQESERDEVDDEDKKKEPDQEKQG